MITATLIFIATKSVFFKSSRRGHVWARTGPEITLSISEVILIINAL